MSYSGQLWSSSLLLAFALCVGSLKPRLPEPHCLSLSYRPAGVLSMGRYNDPNSGSSSFSILLGDAPHLDMQYTAFALSRRGGGAGVGSG